MKSHAYDWAALAPNHDGVYSLCTWGRSTGVFINPFTSDFHYGPTQSGGPNRWYDSRGPHGYPIMGGQFAVQQSDPLAPITYRTVSVF